MKSIHQATNAKYAVIFRSQRASSNEEEYIRAATHIAKIITQQPGFIDYTSFRDANGRGVTISYWNSPQAVVGWKNQPDHLEVQKQGPKWYLNYSIEVCKIEREYGFPSTPKKES